MSASLRDLLVRFMLERFNWGGGGADWIYVKQEVDYIERFFVVLAKDSDMI